MLLNQLVYGNTTCLQYMTDEKH